MKKFCIIFVLEIFLFGCKEKTKEAFYGKSFFDFGEVVHYSNKTIDEKLRIGKEDDNEDNIKDKLLFEIVTGYFPEQIPNEDFEEILQKYDYSKSIINSSKHNQITTLFSESECENDYAFACAPVFRDILIFKKENKVIGIAKICFECEKQHIIGTDKKVINFGECGGFEKLYNLLEN